MVTPVNGLVPVKTDGEEKINLPEIPDHSTARTLVKQLKASNGLETEDLTAIARTRNKRQPQPHSDTINQVPNTNQQEQVVGGTGNESNESDLSPNLNATTNDTGDSIKPRSLSRLIKELTAYNSLGEKESEVTIKQDTGRLTRQPVRRENV